MSALTVTRTKHCSRETRYFLPYFSFYLTGRCFSLFCSFLFLLSSFSRWASLNLVSLEFSWPQNVSILRNNIFAMHKCFMNGKPQKIYILHCQDQEIFKIWHDSSRQVLWNKHYYFQILVVIWKIHERLLMPRSAKVRKKTLSFDFSGLQQSNKEQN